jgi:cystathionine beta-lyase
MSQRPAFDISLDRLREIGGLKWSQHPDKIGAFVAEMDFGVAGPVAEAMHRAVDDGLLGYLPGPLDRRLAEAYAGWAREQHGWEVPVDRVRPIADVITALQIVLEHYSRPGSAVIIPTPAYMPFLYVPGGHGREVVQVPVTDSARGPALDLDAVDAAFAAGAGVLVLTNPHNPLGRVFEREELEAVSEVVERHGGRVFSDEIHAPLVYDGHRHVPYASISEVAARHTVTATAATKAWNLPGTKCGLLVLSNDADVETWAEVGRMYDHGASNLGVVASTAAYEQGGPWLAEVLEHLDGNRRLLGDLLHEHTPQIGYVPPQGTYLAWLDCRALDLGDHPGDFFTERAGVVPVDGLSCGAAGAGFVRLNFATPRPILTETVERMAAALAGR